MPAYWDTPRRFSNEKKLWKYCGVGLQRTARKLLSVLWAMWKTNSRFDESLVCYSPVTAMTQFEL